MATYYIDINHGSASNANAGTSESAPWLDWGAIETRSFSPNDVIYVKNGTYAHDHGIQISTANGQGTAGNPITLRAYPGHTNVIVTRPGTPGINSVIRALNCPTVNHYWRIQGIEFRRMVEWGTYQPIASVGNEISYCRFNGSEYTSHPDTTRLRPGLYLNGQINPWIHHNEFHGWTTTSSTFNGFNCGAMIVYTSHLSIGSGGYIIEDNWVHDCKSGIFDKEGGNNNHYRRNFFENVAPFAGNNQGRLSNSQFYNNVSTGMGAFFLVHLTDGSKYYNNLFPGCRWFIDTDGLSLVNMEFYNNVIIGLGSGGVVWISDDQGYRTELFAYYDNNVYGGTPVYNFDNVVQPLSYMTARGHELNSAAGVALSAVYDTGWALKTPYKTSGRNNGPVGPVDGTGNSIVALIRTTSRYGPTALDEGTPPANNPPNASFSFEVTALEVDVDASGSSDIDGTIADPGGYAWNWGDGSAAGSGKVTSHTYAESGTYNVTLTVTDDDSATDQQTQQVQVESSPGGGFLQLAAKRVSPGRRVYVPR